MIILSFIVVLLLFLYIGISSSFRKKNNQKDYLLASNNTPAWMLGLSAMATANSGFMFTGMIGYVYVIGLSAMWFPIAWILGDYLSSAIVHKRLYEKCHKNNLLTFSDIITKWHGGEYKYFKIFSNIIIVIFLVIYAAAQLNAGSKALYAMLGWPYKAGALIGCLMVIVYCFSGGLRASIWTDSAQAIVMLFAMAILCLVSYNYLSQSGSVTLQLSKVSDNYLNIFPSKTLVPGAIGIILFILGWFSGGVGVTGQPHVMVRFMAMRDAKDFNKVRFHYYLWYSIFNLLSVCVGLFARIIIPDLTDFELALPLISIQLLPGILVGVILSGLFASTMSTADSQILSCSAAITNNIKSVRTKYLLTKFSTIGVAFMAFFYCYIWRQ